MKTDTYAYVLVQILGKTIFHTIFVKITFGEGQAILKVNCVFEELR